MTQELYGEISKRLDRALVRVRESLNNMPDDADRVSAAALSGFVLASNFLAAADGAITPTQLSECVYAYGKRLGFSIGHRNESPPQNTEDGSQN